MGRSRKHTYVDVYLKEGELKKLKKGYAITKKIKHLNISIHSRNIKVQRKIDKLKKLIRDLKGESK